MYHILTLYNIQIITVFTGFQFYHQPAYNIIYLYNQRLYLCSFYKRIKYLSCNPNPRGLCSRAKITAIAGPLPSFSSFSAMLKS